MSSILRLNKSIVIIDKKKRKKNPAYSTLSEHFQNPIEKSWKEAKLIPARQLNDRWFS